MATDQNPNTTFQEKEKNTNSPSQQTLKEDDDVDDLDDGGDLDEYDEEEDEEEEYEEEEEDTLSAQRKNLQILSDKLSSGPVRIRVHDVIIKGNKKTKDSVIEAEVLEAFKNANTLQELLNAARIANLRLLRLGVFKGVSITLDAGPPELPGTANVVIEIVEPESPLAADFGAYTKPGARTCSFEGTVKWKNIFGYADIFDISGSYGWDQTTEFSAGLSLPRFKFFRTPLSAKASVSSQDWLKFSSYKERLYGLSFSLLSSRNHNLAYDLTWRHLTDPSHMASKTVRRHLGHSLLSAIKYTFSIDHRDSHVRPRKGWAFRSSTLISGLVPDSNCLRFIRQELEVRTAFPLGYFNSALNFGVAAGVLIPWGGGFLKSPSPLSDRFHFAGNTSPINGGISSLLGFKTRGIGPSDLRRFVPVRSGVTTDPQPPETERDFTGGDLAVTAFADLSFDLPLELFRRAGIHGHLFASAGNLANITENEFRNFSPKNFIDTARTSVGIGAIVPTKFFRMEINYCYVVKQSEFDKGKTGIQFAFASM